MSSATQGPERKYFFAYAREDSEFVLRLAKDLRAKGVNLWLDQLDVVGGQRWDHAVESALQRCEGMVAVLSPDAIASQNVMDEVSYGLEEGKLIIPALLRPTTMPFRLRRVQYVDFTVNHEAGLAQLLRAVDNAAHGRPITNERPVPLQDGGTVASALPPKTPEVRARSPNAASPQTASATLGTRWLRTRALQHVVMMMAGAGYALADPSVNEPAYVAAFASAGAIAGTRWIAIAGAAVGGVLLHLIGIDVFGIVPGAIAGLALDVWRNKQRQRSA